jgi:hypothetical protein
MLEIGFGQTEGISPAPGNRYFVSSESYSNALLSLPASIFVVSPPIWKNAGNEPEPEPGSDPEPDPDPDPSPDWPGAGQGGNGLRVYRAPGSNILEYALEQPRTILARAVYDAAGRRVFFDAGPGDPPGQLDVSNLETSVYYLALYVGDRILSRPFLSY